MHDVDLSNTTSSNNISHLDISSKSDDLPKITIEDALSIAKAIQQVDLPSSKLDIGKLAYECHLNPKGCEDKVAFIKKKNNNNLQ